MASTNKAPDDGTDDPYVSRPSMVGFFFRRLVNFELRELWWALLDYLETRRALRWTLYGSLTLLVVLVVSAFTIYPWWQKRNAIKLANEWLDAGKLNHASAAVQDALKAAPENPEAWRVAARYARVIGNNTNALDYSKHAASLAPEKIEFALEWAADAAVAHNNSECEDALNSIPRKLRDVSGQAHRIQGQLALRQLKFGKACEHFEASVKLEGPLPNNEIPLGDTLLHSTDSAQRARGLALIEKWVSDKGSGVMALRVLLAYSFSVGDRPAMHKWAIALRDHPVFSNGDAPHVLSALAASDEAAFNQTFLYLCERAGNRSDALAFTLGMLNEIGQSEKAINFVDAMPLQLASRPPIALVKAEAFRLKQNWAGLKELTSSGQWGDGLDHLRRMFLFLAASKTGETMEAETVWNSLLQHCRSNLSHSYFVGSTLLTWGYTKEAEDLLWLAAEEHSFRLDVLGILLRTYQMNKDALGQFRVFKILYGLKPNNPDMINNYAFFAALLDRDGVIAARLAAENHKRYPSHLMYRATAIFALARQGRQSEALVLARAVSEQMAYSPALRYAYGYALLRSGQKAEAKRTFSTVDSAQFTKEEIELIQ